MAGAGGVPSWRATLRRGRDGSEDAEEYIPRIDSKIVLIDGPRLCELMIDHGIGVATYEVKRVDSDYFSDA
jgi:restriction system protein